MCLVQARAAACGSRLDVRRCRGALRSRTEAVVRFVVAAAVRTVYSFSRVNNGSGMRSEDNNGMVGLQELLAILGQYFCLTTVKLSTGRRVDDAT